MMQVFYDSLNKGYKYPITKKDLRSLSKIIPTRVLDSIDKIRFGCNNKTTREGRLVILGGGHYNIRINFCPYNNHSNQLSHNARYIEQITQCGGVVIQGRNSIYWEGESAKKYGHLILLHEIGHIILIDDIDIPFDKSGSVGNEEE